MNPPFATPDVSLEMPPESRSTTVASGMAAQQRAPTAVGSQVAVSNRPIPLSPSATTLAGPIEQPLEEERNWTDLLSDAPAWLLSALFHMVLLILLGIWAAMTVSSNSTDGQVEIVAEPLRYVEQLGDQLTDPSVLEPGGGKEQLDALAEKQILTQTNLPPVDDPFAAPPSATEIALGGRWAASDIHAPVIGLALTGRQTGTKNVLLGKYGGNATTESSVLKGLEWLAKQQKPNGLWSLSGPYQDGAAEDNPAAATAMALLAFQGQGTTHRSGKFMAVVKKGWDALLKQQNGDGDFVRQSSPHQRLYAQAQCTIVICELYGMTQDSALRRPAEKAIEFAIKSQDSQGGWRYTPNQDSDTSVTGWFVMALQSARMAKLRVPEETLNKVMSYLDSVELPDGRYTYTKGSFSTLAVTAEAYLCRQYLGWPQNDTRLVNGVKALNQQPVSYNSSDRDVYYWYYATQACHHMEGETWNDWNRIMRQEVPSHQVQQGSAAGSWDPQGDRWGDAGGRLYVTCLSIYMLEVYYRHLPIYSAYKYVSSN